MQLKYLIQTVLLGILLTSCSKNPFDTDVFKDNNFVYNKMQDVYLWNDKIPKVDPLKYESTDQLLADMLYKSKDKWSYIEPKADYSSYYENGTYIGFGWTGYILIDRLALAVVYHNSPAAKAGLKRGDQITNINGRTIAEITAGNLWSTIYGADEAGIKADLKLSDGRNITLYKESVVLKTVLISKIITRNGHRIGYISFKNFIEPSREELKAVITSFKNQVDEVVLDLRYNGGGRVNVGIYLAELLAGSKIAGKPFIKYQHNSHNQNWNKTVNAGSQELTLNLNRLYVLTTNLTASASEMLINCLKPYMSVISIGGTTHGKPVGMYSFEFGNKVLVPISFYTYNANDQGDYFNGFVPAVTASDDLDHQLGDENELMLKAAISQITGEKIESKPAKELKLPIIHGLKSEYCGN